MNQAPSPFQPSRFATLRTTTPVPVSWETIISELTGPHHEGPTRLYRQTIADLRQAEQINDNQLLQKLKKDKDRIKQNQPAFAASVSFNGGRTSAHITGYSGFIMVDIDDIPPERFAETFRLVKKDPHTFLAHTTISGTGIRVFARIEKTVTKQHFPLAWQTVNEHYAHLTGICYDPKCKNATRMSVICHAPDTLYRPDALPFPLPDEKGEKRVKKAGRPPRSCSASQAEQTVRSLVEREGIAYREHSHNDYICRSLYWMNRFGVSREEAENWALTAFADYDAASVCATVKSCYALTSEHATRQLKEFKPRSSGGRPSRQASVETMERFVDGYMDIRRNRLTQQAEVKLKGDSQWLRMTDTIENSLWRAMQKAGIHTDLFHLRTLLSSDFVKDFHPLTDYLDSLPPWDGTGDPIGELASRVHTADNRPERFAFCFRRWLVALLAGALDERLPYGRNKVRLPHVASFCATGNNPLFLTDDTGNRRWLVFEVTHIDNPWNQPFDYDAIYAQAKTLLDRGFRYWFKDKEIDELNNYNRQFEMPNPARELLLTYYRKPAPHEKGHYLTASQIVARFGNNIRLTTAQVGRMLKELKFANLHTRHGNFWLMVERSIDEITTLLPEKLE